MFTFSQPSGGSRAKNRLILGEAPVPDDDAPSSGDVLWLSSDDNISPIGVWVFTERVSPPCNKSTSGARRPSGVPLENMVVSGRQVCCNPGIKTNFSISWFKPSTEFRMGRVWWPPPWFGRCGINTGFAFVCTGLASVCELTEFSPRCVRCNLCRMTFSIFRSGGEKFGPPPLVDRSKNESSVCVDLFSCRNVHCGWMLNVGRIYNASNDAVLRIISGSLAAKNKKSNNK